MNDSDDEKLVLNLGGCTLVLRGICREGDTHVSARCVGIRSSAEIADGIAFTEHLFVWRDSLKKMYETLEGGCNFLIVDPSFAIAMECQKLGQLRVTVDISENQITESHTFKYELDQSYLPEIIQKLFMFLESPPKFGCNLNSEEDDQSLIILP